MAGASATAIQTQLTQGAAYVETDLPAELVPVVATGAPAGTPIPFFPGNEVTDIEKGDFGIREMVTLDIGCRQSLITGGQFTFNGHQWTVIAEGDHRAGTLGTVYHYQLKRQAESKP